MYQHKTMPGKANNVITGDHIRPNQHAVSQFFLSLHDSGV